SMEIIAQRGRGAVVLIRDTSKNLVPAEGEAPKTLRQYGVGAQILSALGLSKITLLSNSQAPKIVGLEAYGLSIEGTHPIEAN
ncbi:MAG: 3,4-dihydroxy-2-butanone-4-phosphate synthase, partial [Paracoccaceae bacterium]|nr:3,4-dihydroxy-2-butanone-4-phosphate synthase [Paracoccaceae bacterium]